jgi:hypothetical protein
MCNKYLLFIDVYLLFIDVLESKELFIKTIRYMSYKYSLTI